MISHYIVTTVYDASPELITRARCWSEKLHTDYIPRERRSIAALMNIFNTEIIVVGANEGPIIYTPGGKYFFHLSMAELRIKNLINGKHDHMVTAMGLAPGMSVLDCTLGLASDAIVASYVTGTEGTIVGLEHSPILSLVAEEGLQTFASGDIKLAAALRRIRVHQTDYLNYLKELPDNSFDIVFFDPMFREPVTSSSNLKPLRYLADSRPLDYDALKQAVRVASTRVVVKEKRNSTVFNELGIFRFIGGRYSSIQYGVLEVDI